MTAAKKFASVHCKPKTQYDIGVMVATVRGDMKQDIE